MRTAIHVSILRSDLGDCTGGGVTSKAKGAYLLAEGIRGNYSEAEAEAAALKGACVLVLVKRWAGTANEYLHAEPLDPITMEPLRKPHAVGPMFGGNFVHTSDSRFPNSYPIPVHDRYETQADYDANFD